jgi:CBS domain-containing protein
LPVYDETKKRFFGFIDVLDITNFVTKLAHAYKHGKKATWIDYLTTETLFNEATCGSVKNASHHDMYTQVVPEANITTAISLMTAFDSIHRLAIVGPYPNYELLGIITQSDVLQYLWANLDHKLPVFNKTVSELNLGLHKVISVPLHHKLVDAWKTLKNSKVSGIAVVDADGLLVGNISASDIRLDKEFSIDSIIDLSHQPVSWVLEQHKQTRPADKPYPVSVTPSATVADVINAIIDNHVHRIYVVDEHKKIQGVITIADILRLFNH